MIAGRDGRGRVRAAAAGRRADEHGGKMAPVDWPVRKAGLFAPGRGKLQCRDF